MLSYSSQSQNLKNLRLRILLSSVQKCHCNLIMFTKFNHWCQFFLITQKLSLVVIGDRKLMSNMPQSWYISPPIDGLLSTGA